MDNEIFAVRQGTPTTLLYGGSGNRKTSQIGNFAKYIYEKTGKKTRLITADTGGYEPIQDFIQAGLIEVFDLTKTRNPMPALKRIYAGHWADHNVIAEFGMAHSAAQLTTAELKELNALWGKPSVSDVGGYAIEGITSISELAMRNMVLKGLVINGEGVNGVLEEGFNLGAAPRTFYNVVHQYIVELFTNFPQLPVHRILYTAHESKGKDSLTETVVFGPASVGKALTPVITKYVGDLLHAESVGIARDPKKPKREAIEVRCYFQNHPDSEQPKLTWPAKARIQPAQIGALLERYPDGWFPLTFAEGIEAYFHTLDELRDKAANNVRQWMDAVRPQQAAA